MQINKVQFPLHKGPQYFKDAINEMPLKMTSRTHHTRILTPTIAKLKPVQQPEQVKMSVSSDKITKRNYCYLNGA